MSGSKSTPVALREIIVVGKRITDAIYMEYNIPQCQITNLLHFFDIQFKT